MHYFGKIIFALLLISKGEEADICPQGKFMPYWIGMDLASCPIPSGWMILRAYGYDPVLLTFFCALIRTWNSVHL